MANYIQTPALIRRCDIEQLLGGIGRTTFYRRRLEWEAQGTPFPKPLNWMAKGGTLWRRHEVIAFLVERGLMLAESHPSAQH
ncbi:TPA: hypothetical protein RVR74_000430 [Aeromonas salmonicida]|uniref:helix-turn-helix transcriptional regulator n=1 Tax=Aeromonas salmonicida TaxID=645 RepID=UPI000FAD5042|nr:hypothetical protein [Aeromonas salmonicida]MCE9936382.1 hypothetical protein [Aeromonas salmonicida]MDR7018260.1 hypothetical protein [Aeromonas salmonicida]HEA3088151.1 hypothetical protein [Aeromonas salmonicida]